MFRDLPASTQRRTNHALQQFQLHPQLQLSSYNDFLKICIWSPDIFLEPLSCISNCLRDISARMLQNALNPVCSPAALERAFLAHSMSGTAPPSVLSRKPPMQASSRKPPFCHSYIQPRLRASHKYLVNSTYLSSFLLPPPSSLQSVLLYGSQSNI